MYLLAGRIIATPAERLSKTQKNPCVVDQRRGFWVRTHMPELPLTRGKVTLVDEADFAYLSQWKWKCTSTGYAARALRKNEEHPGRIVYLHRVIAKPREDEEVDHINTDKLDNRRENLRCCNSAENKRNRTHHKNNRLKLKGAFLHSSKTCYQARICTNRKVTHLGCFKTAEEAHEAYKAASLEQHKAFSRS